MSILLQINPFEFFVDADGDALDAGYIYIGEPNKDPQQYPVQVFYDSALTIPAPQPLRTSNGYVLRNGSPTFLFINGNYSIRVLDKKQRQVYYVADFLLIGNQAPLTQDSLVTFLRDKSAYVRDTIAQLRTVDSTKYMYAYITGYYAKGDGGGGFYYYDASDLASLDNGGTVIVAADNARWKLIRHGEPVSIRQFGAKGDGVANDTPAIQAAVNSVTSVFAPPGTYLIDTVFFPNSTSDSLPLGRTFTGTDQTIFLQNSVNTPMFKKEPTAGRAYGYEIGPFCVKPKAGPNSTLAAIHTAGFTNTDFIGITGLSNGGTGMWAIITAAASPSLSYFNRFINLTLTGQTGWTKAIEFTNNGAGTLFNSNANVIDTPRIYNNTSLVIAIDAVDSYGVTINTPYIEANPGCVGINMGQTTVVNGGAMEANGSDFNYTDARASNSLVMGTSLGTTQNINFGNAAKSNLWVNVTEINPATWINLPDASNRKIQLIPGANPTPPGLTQINGPAGSISTTIQVVQCPLDPLTREVTYRMEYLFTSAASTATVSLRILNVSPTAGGPQFDVKNISWGVITSSGTVVAGQMQNPQDFFFTPAASTQHTVAVFVTYRQRQA